MSSVSDKLKKLIKDHPDWTQQRLAKELGTSQLGSKLGIPQSRVGFIIRQHIPEYVKKYRGHVNKHS